MFLHPQGRRRSILGALLIIATSAPAFSQVSTETSAANEVALPLTEIIVTAQRRQTALQDTPIAVSAVTGEAIQEQRLINLADIAARVPSITFDQVNPSESFISIRGTTIGNDAAGIDQGVSVFIDDVPTTGFGDNSPDLYDLASVEVLRGPQGTLFGRNVTGGAVLVNTLQPSFTSAGRATLTYGSNNLMEAQGYLTGPVAQDQLAGKIAFDIRRRDNWLPNVTLRDNTGGEDLGSVRGQLLWTPSESLRITVGADHLNDTSASKVQYLEGNFQPSLFPMLVYGPSATNQGSNSFADKKVDGLLAKIEWTLAFATLNSITGYRNVNESTHFSTSGDPFNSIISDPITRDNQLTEEIRLVSRNDQALTWVTGAFFLHGHRAYLQTVNFDAQPGTLLWGAAHVVPSLARFLSPYVSHQNQHVTVESAAWYGEGTYAFTDAFKLTLGGRYSNEKKSGHTEVFDTSVTNPDLATGPYSKSWNSFTPKALLSFEPTRTFLAYLSATKGFESGGYDTNGTTKAALASAYNPEYVWSYEGGFKSEMFERHLRVNMSVYDADYKDLQTRNFDPVSGTIVAGNAAKARVRGVELESQWVPTDFLTLGVTYDYADAKYLSYLTPNASGPATDYSGHTIPNTPRNAVNVNGDLHFRNPFGPGRLSIGGDVTYRTQIQFDDANDTAQFVLDKGKYRGLANLHATWRRDDDKLDFTVWAKNLTNTQSVINSSDLSNFYDTPGEIGARKQVYITTWTAARTAGVSVTGRF
jgi:iron complex outermembrane receptor protein